MGLLDKMVDNSFKTDQDGRRLYFPWGRSRRGYIVPTETEYHKLREQLKDYAACLYLILFIAGSRLNILAAFIFLGIVVAVISLLTYFRCRRLERSDEIISKIVKNGHVAKIAREQSAIALWLYEIIIIAILLAGLSKIYFHYHKLDRTTLLLFIFLPVFLGYPAVIFAKALRLKSRKGYLETTLALETPSIPPVSDRRIISGFWVRVLAFYLDCFILLIVGLLSGLLLFDFYTHLGDLGRLVGFPLALLYFGLLNSSLGKGKTPGKRAMGIEVVNNSGDYISVGRSLGRIAILGFPWFVTVSSIPASILISPVEYIIDFLGWGLAGAILYLYIFNHHSRQSLHDLIAGTFVVNSAPKGSVPSIFIWKMHLVVVAIWFLSSLGFGFVYDYYSSPNEIMGVPKKVYEKIKSSGKLSAYYIWDNNWPIIGERWKNNPYFVVVNFKEKPVNRAAAATAAREIAAIVFDNDPDIIDKSKLDIEMRYGYDSGIAWDYKKWRFSYSIDEWKNYLRNPELMVEAVTATDSPR